MKIDITPELIQNYFHDHCTLAEKKEVERWLKSSNENYQLAMRWLKEEESEEDEKFLAGLLVLEDDVLENTRKAIANLGDKDDFGQKLNLGIRTFKNRRFWYGMAASVSVLLISAWFIKGYFANKLVTVKTGFDKTQKVILPDHSVVTINGNSQLAYKPHSFTRDRQIWMEGEAFFDVRHTSDNGKFQVHLSDDKTVEVLGTEFNVSERNSESRIVLKSGKIRLDIPNVKRNIEMMPGELVRIDRNSGAVVTEKVNAELFYSWIYGKWKFDNATLKEILERVEQTHGIKVYVYNKALMSRSVSGTIPLQEDAKTLVKNIANAFDLKIEDRNGAFYLKEEK